MHPAVCKLIVYQNADTQHYSKLSNSTLSSFFLKEKGNKKYFNINLLGLYLVHTTETNNKRAKKKHASFSIQKF